MEVLITGDLVQARLCPGRVGRVTRVYGKRVDVRWIGGRTVCGAEPRFFTPVRPGALFEVAVCRYEGEPQTTAVVVGAEGILAWLAPLPEDVIARAVVRSVDHRLQAVSEWVELAGLLAEGDDQGSHQDADVRATVPS